MNLFAQLREYLRSSQKELEAVRWPTRQETIRYSALVIGVSVVFAAFFGLLDLGLNSLVQSYVERQPVTTQEPLTEDITPTTTNPIEVEATTASGTPATIQAVPVPLNSSSTK
jgi:preprotein translocase subunit SecE